MTLNGDILVVEDDPNDAYFLRRAFSKLGLGPALWVAIDAEEAKKRLLNDQAPALIVLDLTLPGEGGFALLEWLKSSPEWNSIPVAVLTGSSHPEDRARALTLGAKDFYSKPQASADLLRVVEAILSGPAAISG
jgi:CheY-like chemotaxis protein